MTDIAKTFLSDFVDHEGPNVEPIGVEEDKARMTGLAARFPDLHVDLRDVIAEDDKVVVRGIWTGTDSKTGKRMEFHGFVLWRIENGRFAERWATATYTIRDERPRHSLVTFGASSHEANACKGSTVLLFAQRYSCDHCNFRDWIWHLKLGVGTSCLRIADLAKVN